MGAKECDCTKKHKLCMVAGGCMQREWNRLCAGKEFAVSRLGWAQVAVRQIEGREIAWLTQLLLQNHHGQSGETRCT